MKRKRTLKYLLVSILSALCCLFIGIGCGESNSGFTGFLKGYREYINLGESVIMEEFIDYVDDSDYKITLILGEEEKDYTDRAIWTPEDPGEWTVKYEVSSGKNEGTYTCTVEVKVPTINYQMSITSENVTFEKGETMQFTSFIDSLNVFVSSFYPSEMEMQSVRHNGELTDLKNESQYTFTDRGLYYFTFHVNSTDGQTKKAIVEVKVIQTDEAAKTFMEENGASVHRYNAFDENLSLELDGGTHGKSFSSNDIGYIAYEGEYGEGDYVKFDFTGNNLPKVAFFCKRITPSITDGSAGIYLCNGTLRINGTSYVQLAEFSSLTAYGPYKVKDTAFRIGTDTQNLDSYGSPADPASISRRGLQEGTRYRYIVGFSDVDEVAKTATYHALLINLDTYEIEFDYQGTCDLSESLIEEDYFSGSIVAYGSFGAKTYIDKVYPVAHAASVYEAEGSASLKLKAKSARVGESLDKSVFVDAVASGERFGYIAKDKIDADYLFDDPDFVEVTGDSFAFPATGEYVVAYDKGAGLRPAATTVRVYDDYGTESFEEGEMLYTISFEGSGNANLVAEISADTASSGTQALKVSIPKNIQFRIHISSEYLESIFEGEFVDAFAFDVKFTRALGIRIDASTTPTAVGTEWQTITVTKARYDAWKEKYSTWTWGEEYPDYAIVINTTGEAEGTVLYLDNIRAVKKLNAYVFSKTTGSWEATSSAFANATELQFNGNVVPADKYSVNGNTIAIDNAYLRENALFNNTVRVTTATGKVEFYLQVVKDLVDFEDGGGETLFASVSTGSGAVADDGAGNKAFVVTGGTSKTMDIKLTKEYMAAVFADSTVEKITVSVKLTTSNSTVGNLGFQNAYTSGNTTALTEYVQFELTRAKWNDGAHSGQIRLQAGTGGQVRTGYVDNIQVVYAS